MAHFPAWLPDPVVVHAKQLLENGGLDNEFKTRLLALTCDRGMRKVWTTLSRAAPDPGALVEFLDRVRLHDTFLYPESVRLYGLWSLAQQSKNATRPAVPNSVSPIATTRGLHMKTAQLHSGPYCCPECCIDYELAGEEVLKCDRCNGPLVSGTVDNYFTDDEDDQE